MAIHDLMRAIISKDKGILKSCLKDILCLWLGSAFDPVKNIAETSYLVRTVRSGIFNTFNIIFRNYCLMRNSTSYYPAIGNSL
jgi:hypothetical protein